MAAAYPRKFGGQCLYFVAHSTWGASASAASRAGITTSDILKAANWSSESVFQRFYHKEIDRTAYGSAVIRQNSSRSATNNTVDVCETEPSDI